MISRFILLIPAVIISAASLCFAVDLKEITFTTRDAGKVVFSHKSHLGKKTRTASNFSCKTCHESGKLKTRRYTMAEMEKGKSCGACHDGKGAFKLSECVKCHPVKEKMYAVADAGDVLFSHKFHMGMYSCGECHPKLYIPGKGNQAVPMTGMEEKKSCGACHDGNSAFTVKENCEKCHRMK
jgi:c(7)-type cytochrome triheme protein